MRLLNEEQFHVAVVVGDDWLRPNVNPVQWHHGILPWALRGLSTETMDGTTRLFPRDTKICSGSAAAKRPSARKNSTRRSIAGGGCRLDGVHEPLKQ